MVYEKAKNLKAEEFKRLCGVKPETFDQMVKLVKNNEKLKKKTGRPSKLSLENQVLVTLEYLREYRTYFHIGQTWGLNESTVYRIVTKIEKILINSPVFRLPGKKQLLKSNNQIDVVVVDLTENPIERPKKNRRSIIAEKRKSIP